MCMYTILQQNKERNLESVSRKLWLLFPSLVFFFNKIIYMSFQLKYHTTIHVRSARGKNSRGRKVTGIEPMPG